MLSAIALRNLFRNRRRTVLSLVGVGVGVVSLLLTLGFVRYSFDGLSDAIIRGGLAHLEIAPARDAGAGGGNPLVDRAGSPPAFDGWQAVRERVEQRAGVRAAGAMIQLAGVFVHGDRSMPFLGAASEPERLRRMGIDVRMRDGRALPDAAVPGDDRVLLGVDLARALGVGPGDAVVAMVVTASGTLNALDVTVEGTFSSGFQDLDSRLTHLHLETAQRLLGTEAITALLVGLEDTAATGAMAAAIQADLGGVGAPLTVTDWETRAPFYRQVRGLYLGIFVFLGTIIGLLVGLSTSNTLLMSVLERVREFGMLMAMGTARRQLAGLLVLEAGWLGLIGGVAGCVATVAVAATINALEIQMPPPPAAVDPITLAVLIHPSDFAWAVAFMTLLLAVAAVPPILRILRLRVVEALGHV
jgi:putative ABC transport system permease protein